jgi:hypothetical protein
MVPPFAVGPLMRSFFLLAVTFLSLAVAPARAQDLVALAAQARAAFFDTAWAEAERLDQIGYDLAAQRFGAESPEAAWWLAALADAMCRADATPVNRPWTDRAHSRALPLAERAMRILERAYGPNDIRTGNAYMSYVVALAGLYRHPEGDPYGRRALRIVETTQPDAERDLLVLKLWYYATHLHIIDHNVEAQEYEERLSFAQYGRLIDPARLE